MKTRRGNLISRALFVFCGSLDKLDFLEILENADVAKPKLMASGLRAFA